MINDDDSSSSESEEDDEKDVRLNNYSILPNEIEPGNSSQLIEQIRYGI